MSTHRVRYTRGPTNCRDSLNASFSTNLKLRVGRRAAPVLTKFWSSFGFDHVRDHCGFEAGMRYKLRSRCPVRALLTSTVVAAAIALAGCTSDGTSALSGNADSISGFIRNLFGSKSEDQPPVAHNEAPLEPSAPKAKSATSKPKRSAVAAARAHAAKLAKRKTVVPKPTPERKASAEPPSPPESSTPPVLSGAAPTLPTGSFENRVGSRR